MDPADRNRVGIIGAGRLGQAMARTALRAGRSVVIANSRGPASLTAVVSTLGAGASAGTVAQASAAGIVVIAVPWARVPEAVQGLEWDGQIVLDATNDFDPSDLDGRQAVAQTDPTGSLMALDAGGSIPVRPCPAHLGTAGRLESLFASLP
jgi:predicted dinucleotide-binding enzyme